MLEVPLHLQRPAQIAPGIRARRHQLGHLAQGDGGLADPATLEQVRSERGLGAPIGRLDCDRLAIGRLGVLAPAHALERVAETDVGIGVLRVAPDQPAVGLRGGIEPPRNDGHAGERLLGLDQRGIEFESLPTDPVRS